MKATKTPHVVINPFKYGESTFWFKSRCLTKTVMREEKESKRMNSTMIFLWIVSLTISHH